MAKIQSDDAALTVADEDPYLERKIQVLKALGHPIRFRLVALLGEGPLHVTALADALGVPQSVVSQQLRVLRMCQLVRTERQGGLAVYRLAERDLVSLLDCLDRWCV